MIQFNLLPDVKLEYLKTERTKRLVISISLIVAGVSLAILILLFSALELQNHSISNNKKEIKKYTDQLTGTTDVNKILTIQNQLKTIVNLYNGTPVTTRLYDYLPQLVPQDIHISSLSLDMTNNAVIISGDAPNLEAVNTFADTLKFANYKTDQASGKRAFTAVTLSSFNRDQKGASYSFTATFDPVLFSRGANVKLDIPANYISTRSFTELPSNDLFKSSSDQGSPSP